MAIMHMTAPLVGFQVVGHVFSSIAISRVPLSFVHTIKVSPKLPRIGVCRLLSLEAVVVTTKRDEHSQGTTIHRRRY
jgi:hypothetical protein